MEWNGMASNRWHFNGYHFDQFKSQGEFGSWVVPFDPTSTTGNLIPDA
jgi:hypothetical protein